MSYREQLIRDINAKLDALAEEGTNWSPRWIAHELCKSHQRGLRKNADADFWRHGTYQHVRDEARRAINRRAGDRTDDALPRQLELPGFEREHLQDYYVVERDGEEAGVCVLNLSDDEIERKAALLRSMAATCYAHADELERFRNWRKHHAEEAERAA